MKKMLIWLMALALCLTLIASAEEHVISVETQRFELAENLVSYPKVTGLADSVLEETINRQLVSGLHADVYLARVALLLSSPVKMQADHQTQVYGNVLSAVMEAQGAVVNNRSTHVWSAVNIDLTSGDVIRLEDLFTDPDAALAAMEEILTYDIEPELSAHLSAGALTPIPQTFALSPTGLTLYYPIDQLSTLSDQAGAVKLHFSEIADHLDISEGSVLDRLGVQAHLSMTEDSLPALQDSLAQGQLGDIPLTIGESVQALTDAHGLLIDPDLYEGGRMFQLEGAEYRKAFLLTDALSEEWDASIVQGVRADRLNWHGLCTGKTLREEWLAVLGEPETTLTVEEMGAQQWRIVPGQSDYYTFGPYRLRLHADESGVLRSVFLMK